MKVPQFFNNIPLHLDHGLFYRRLGYREGLTKVTKPQVEEIESAISSAESLIACRASCLRLDIQSTFAGLIVLEGGYNFKSQLLERVLDGCSEALLMGATAGRPIAEEIRSLSSDKLSQAVVYDAVASEMADAVFLWLEKYFEQVLLRERKQLLGKRISCGYSDFSLENQQVFYKALQLEDLNIAITSQFMLSPEKSVTAITGIKDI